MDKKTINNVLNNQATAPEAREVARWFATPKGQLDAASRMDADWDQLVRGAQARAQRSNKEHSLRKHINRVAAVLLLLFIGGATFQLVQLRHQPAVEMRNVCAERGRQMQVMLQDGTMIYLNSGSHILFPSRFTEANRTISLVGEAYFEVAKDPDHPFIVELNGVSIEVLGTSFNVYAFPDEPLRVSLDEGAVLFHSANQDVRMPPGETLSYNPQNEQITLTRKTDTNLASAWKAHRIEVTDMPMRELTNMLSRRYDVHFAISDEECYENTYSLSMSDTDLRSIIHNMVYVSPIRAQYDAENRVVTISKR